jgi:cell division protein FtsB
MPFIVKTENGQQIKLEDTPFTSGGEGELYKIVSPQSLSDHCVKIYYSQYQTQQKAEKLRFMANHKPQQITDKTNYMICWVVDLVFRQGAFVGFLMPLAFDNSIQLYELCTTKIRRNLASIWHQKFDRNNDTSIENRLKLCVNIAIAIHNIHNTKNYVLVDMKPQNILLCPEGKVSIVDLDSIQISNGIQVIHQGHVATPEYTPAEGTRLSPSNDYIPETWDRFSLAIIFYELIFGLHPFVATSTGQYEHITTIDEAIKNGLFVFGSKSQFLQLPLPHNNFQLLPQSIKDCFVKALDKGHNNPNARPTAEEWGKVLFEELQLETEKTNISCPICNHTIRVPKYKHIKANCPKCNTKVEVKNGSLVGYVSEKIVEKQIFVDKPIEKIITVEKQNSFFTIVSVILGIGMFFGYTHFNSQLQKSQETVVQVQSLQSTNQSLKQTNQELEDKNKKLSSIVAKISNNQPFIIESIDFSNDTKNGNKIDDYTNRFTYSRIRYISPRVKIIPLVNESQFSKSVTIYVKLIEPNGSINRNPSISPRGYTYKSEDNIYSSTEYLYVGGWGNDNGGTYEIGTHRVEIWCNGKLIGSGSFEVTY